MYAFLSIALFFVGTALLVLVLVRKIPVLANLPPEEAGKGSLFSRAQSRAAQIDWKRWKRLLLIMLAFLVEKTRRLFVRVVRAAEKSVRGLNVRLLHLADTKTRERKPAQFFSRIRKRAAYVEEERRLIEQLTANPQDVDVYRRLGNLYVIAGNVADAKAAFSEILRLVPDDEEAKRRLRELSTASNGE